MVGFKIEFPDAASQKYIQRLSYILILDKQMRGIFSFNFFSFFGSTGV
jgi:hypothetical protein